jgi:hypothetical protein
MNESWQLGYNKYTNTLYSNIIKDADEIRKDIDLQNENANKIAVYYNMIKISYDPISHMMLEESYNKWKKEKTIERS